MEKQVVRMFKAGYSVDRIADELFVSKALIEDILDDAGIDY